jgi:hypothetical protein
MPFQTDEEVEIYVIGYDPLSQNTEYFTRRILVNGEDVVYFQCPQTPTTLRIIAWSKGTGKFTIPKVDMVPMERNLKIMGEHLPDILFIENFARRCGRFPARRTYTGDGAKFKIQLLPVIRHDNGQKHVTPARIHTQLPLIQVSKSHFDRMSIPQRVAILTHEYSHNFINYDEDSEFEADSNMLDLYQGLGYGKLEAVYAFANVMSDTDTNYDRLMEIQNQL